MQTLGFLISNKENEKRRALLLEHIENKELNYINLRFKN